MTPPQPLLLSLPSPDLHMVFYNLHDVSVFHFHLTLKIRPQREIAYFSDGEKFSLRAID